MAEGGRTYTITFPSTAFTGATTMVQLQTAAGFVHEILRVDISPAIGAALANESLGIALVRKSAAGTLTQRTPQPTIESDAAANITAAGTGSGSSAEGTEASTYYNTAFSLLTGWLWVPTPGEILTVRGSSANNILAVILRTAPSASRSFAGTVTIKELA